MIDQAEEIGPTRVATIQVQANRYEGFTVWANALIESAGSADPLGPDEVEPRRRADQGRAHA